MNYIIIIKKSQVISLKNAPKVKKGLEKKYKMEYNENVKTKSAIERKF